MMTIIKTWFERFSYYGYDWIRALQSVLLKVSLFFIYFFGIGFSRLIMPIFGRRLLIPFKVDKGQDSYWMDASGYNEEGLDQFNKQV